MHSLNAGNTPTLNPSTVFHASPAVIQDRDGISLEKMPVPPVNIPMVPRPMSPPALLLQSILTGTQASNTSPAVAAGQTTVTGNTVNTTSNGYSTLTSPAPTSNPQTKHGFPWRMVRRICVIIAKVIFGTGGAIMAYLALSAAMWSAVKDYRDDCRSQLETYGQVSQACTEALHAALSSPLGLSLFISKHDADHATLTPRSKTGVGSSNAEVLLSLQKFFAIIAACNIFSLFISIPHRRFQLRVRAARNGSQSSSIGNNLPDLHATRIGSFILKRMRDCSVLLAIPDLTSLCLRFWQRAPGELVNDIEMHSGWIDVGVSAVRNDFEQSDGPSLVTTDEGVTHDHSTWSQSDSSQEASRLVSGDDNFSIGNSNIKPLLAPTEENDDAYSETLPLPHEWQTSFQKPEQHIDSGPRLPSISAEGLHLRRRMESLRERLNPPLPLHGSHNAHHRFSTAADCFSHMLDQYYQLEYETMIENLTVKRASTFWNPLEAMRKRDGIN